MFLQFAVWKCLPHGILIASLLVVSWGQYDDGKSTFTLISAVKQGLFPVMDIDLLLFSKVINSW